MNARLRTSHIVLAGLGTALATITACSSPDTAAEKDVAKTTQASSVTIAMKDGTGKDLGSCSGTLIGPKMVLTAGHCISGVASWEVVSTAGKSSGTVASTPWKAFGSNLSHPEHSDVGLILLKDAIKLKTYPALANKAVKDGASGVMFQREANGKTPVSSSAILKAGANKGFKLNYTIELPKSEQNKKPDTGGAVVDSSGKIIGVISGRGKATNLLHVARVDGFSGWAKAAVACSTAATSKTWGGGGGGGGGTSNAGYGGTPANPAPGSGGVWGGGGGGGGWGGGGGGWGGGGGGWGGGGGGWGSSSGGYGGNGGKPNNNPAKPGDVVPGSGGKPGPGPDGILGTADDTPATGGPGTPGSPGSPGSTPGSTGGDDDDDSSTPGTPGSEPNESSAPPNSCPGIPACIGEACGDGSNGLGSGTSDDGKPSGTPGSSGSNGNGGDDDDDDSTTTSTGPDGVPNTKDDTKTTTSSGPDGIPGTADDTTTVTTTGPDGIPGTADDVSTTTTGPTTSTPSSSTPGTDTEGCEGATDNSETCPAAPDSARCSGPTCGGCGGTAKCEDNNVDYGDCASCGAGADGTTTDVVK